MAYSARYKALEGRLATLRKHFIPSAFSKSGLYTSKQLDDARAYRLLCHAELEHYLEERTLEIADLSFRLWITKSRSSSPLISILSNVIGEQNGLPKKLGTNNDTNKIVSRVVAQYRHAVLTNNGIRTSNILTLLLPIGILEGDIDPAWIATIDGFGAKRGTAAHTTSISYQIDPKDELQTIAQIVLGIKDIDQRLNAAKSKIR